MKTDDNVLKDISWEDVQKYIHEDIYQEFLKQINPSVFKMALNQNDRPKVTQSILKVLRERDSKNVTEEYAGKIADHMEKIAQMILEQK